MTIKVSNDTPPSLQLKQIGAQIGLQTGIALVAFAFFFGLSASAVMAYTGSHYSFAISILKFGGAVTGGALALVLIGPIAKAIHILFYQLFEKQENAEMRNIQL